MKINEDEILSNGEKLTSYLATAYAEGFEEAPNEADVLKSWAYLIRTGLAWKLQGFFGRRAVSLIERGLIYENGKIDWKLFEQIKQQVNN